MNHVLAALLTLSSVASAAWTPEGRTVSRSSTSRTDVSVDFTLLTGEDPVAAVLGCQKATRAGYPNVNFVTCTAFTPQGFAKLFGKVRACFLTTAQWFAEEQGMIRLFFAQDDRRYPKSCPALNLNP